MTLSTHFSTVTIWGTSTIFSTIFYTTFSTSTILGTTLKTFRMSSTFTTPMIYCLIIPTTPSSISGITPDLAFIFSISSRRALMSTLKWNSTFRDFSLLKAYTFSTLTTCGLYLTISTRRSTSSTSIQSISSCWKNSETLSSIYPWSFGNLETNLFI